MTVVLALSLCASTAEAQYRCPPQGCPLPPAGTYMPMPQRPYYQPERDPYWRPVPPGVNLEREFHQYGGRPQRLCPSPRGPVPC